MAVHSTKGLVDFKLENSRLHLVDFCVLCVDS